MTVEAAAEISQQNRGAVARQGVAAGPDLSQNGTPLRIHPDLDFIRSLSTRSGAAVKKCFQCGTCSAICTLSPDLLPFPRKEMAWAAWGMKETLLNDPDIWLCYQCNDCSTACPRGARPGDVLASIRQEAIVHHAFPRFFGAWARQPHCIPMLLGIPAALLTLALLLRDPLQKALGIPNPIGERLVFPYSNVLPRWLLNGFFFLFTALAIILLLGGVLRFWQAMKATCSRNGNCKPARGLLPSIASVMKGLIVHDKFSQCTQAHSRYWSHLSVFLGFLALSLVTLWVITAPYNPLIADKFVYPFGFWNPWKILANLGGAAVLAGCLLMIRDRLRDRGQAAAGSYFDWALIATLMVVTLTGYFTEALHYVRLEPHRHLAYFVHLVFVGALLLFLPYSKLAHMVYRTTALVCAERYGRNAAAGPSIGKEKA